MFWFLILTRNCPAEELGFTQVRTVWTLAIQRNAFGRALKLNKQPDLSGITKEQAETMLAKNE